MDHYTTNEKDSIKQNLKIKLLYILKKASPKNTIFYYLFFCLKLIGMLILSHDFTRIYSGDEFSITKFIRKVTFLGELESDFFTSVNYNTLSIFIFCMIAFPYISLYLIYKILMPKKQTNKLIKIDKISKRLIKILSFLITLTVLLSQHLIEMISFIFLNAYVYAKGINTNTIISSTTSQTIKKEFLDRFIIFNSNLLFGNYYFIFLLNIISFLLINLTVYNFIKFTNEPYLNSKSSIKFSSNTNYMIILVSLFNSQGFHYFSIVFQDAAQLQIKQFFMFVSLSFNLFYILYSLSKFDFSINLNRMLDYVNYVCFISNILDLIIYYSNLNSTQATKFSDTQVFFKLIIEVALASIFFYFINDMKNKRLVKLLSGNLFSKNKKINLNSLLTFSEMIEDSINDSVKFLPIFRMIDNHKNICSEAECACGKYEFNKYLKNLDVSRNMKFLRDEEKLNYFKKMYHDIITLAENEIVNSVYQFFKSKNIENNHRVFLLHVDFIFNFKRNNLLSNYLIEQYRLNIKNLPFLYKFHLHIYKKKLVKNFYENLQLKTSYSVTTSFFDFFKYHETLQTINKFIVKNCENYEKLIYIKKTFDNNQLETNNRDSAMETYCKKLFNNVENIFKSCEDLNKHFEKLCKILEINFKNDRLRNIEMSYLLFNFFSLINKEIPFEIRALFVMVDEYCIIENASSSFNEKKMHHPMIIKTDKGEGFVINYVSQKLCDLIDYKKSELLGKDMHVLIPQIFREQHKLVMKKLIFLEHDTKIQKESFLLTKQQFYFEVYVTASFLPTVDEHVTLILDILPLMENKGNNNNNGFNNQNANCSSKKNKYKFVLDQGTNLISYSKNFEDNFFVDKHLFDKLELSFCQFFNISYDKLMQKCEKDIKHFSQINNLRTNDILKIFQQVDLNDALFFLSDENNFDGNSFDKRKQKIPVSEFLRKKEKLIPTVIKLKKNIQEAEMEQEYLDKLNELEKKFSKNTISNKILNVKRLVSKSFGDALININNNNNNNNENNINFSANGTEILKEFDGDQIRISFYLNNIGSIPYFAVTVIENKDTFEEKHVDNYRNQSSLNCLPIVDYSNYNINNMNNLNDNSNIIETNNIPYNFFNNANNGNSIMKNDHYATNLITLSTDNQNFYNSSNNNNINNNNNNYLNLNTNTINPTSSLNANFENFGGTGTSSKNPTLKTHDRSITKSNLNFLKNLKTNSLSSITNQNTNGVRIGNLPTLTNNLNFSNNANDSIQQLLQLNKGFSDFNLSQLSYKNARTFLSTYTSKSAFLIKVDKKGSQKRKKLLGTKNSNNNEFKSNISNNNSLFASMNNFNQERVNLREKIIFVLLFSLLFIQIFLSFFSFTLKNGIAEYSFDLFSINYYALLTKLTLYYTSSSVISACTSLDIDPQNVDNFSFDVNEFQKNFKLRSGRLLKSLNKFTGILARTDSSKNSEIYDLINSEIDFKILYSDWSFYTRKSTILKELSYFHYYIAQLQYPGSFSKCRLKEYFYKQNFMNTKTSAYIDNNRNTETNANFEETVLYYIVYNVFQNFRENLEKISANINVKLNDYLNNSHYTLLFFNLITLTFGILLIFIVTFSIKNYRQKILKLIYDIFIKDKTDPLFLDKLKNFMTIAKDFDKKICLDFEEENKRIIIEELIKLNCDPQLFLNDELIANTININNNNNNSIDNNFINNAVANDSVNNSTFQLLNNNNINININNNINKNSIDINNNKKTSNSVIKSFNIAASNNSSGRNNHKQRTKNKKENLIKNNNNKNTNNPGTVSNNTSSNNKDNSAESAQTQNERKFTTDFSNINILIIKISYMILLIAFCCYVGLSISNILINKTQYKSLLVANQISLNFLDRIPKFAELILYFRISVIFNNVNFITTAQENYKSLVSSDYFNQRFTPDTETLFNSLKESEFSHIYYNLLIVRKNIDMFMRSDDAVFSSILPNIRNHEKKMNSPEFCAVYRLNNNIIQSDDVSVNSQKTLLDAFGYLNSEAKECLKIGNGINKYGMNIAFDSILASTKNLYLDFLRAGEAADITATLTDKNFIRAGINTEYTFNKAHFNYLGMILSDMTDLYDGVKNSEFIFSCVGLAFNCVFILFIVLGVFKKLQRYFISLNSAVDKFKVALVDNKDKF